MLKKRSSIIIIATTIFIVSLIIIGIGEFLPKEKTREVILGNYSHNGRFTCNYYTALITFPSRITQSTSILFPQIIEDMEILFEYSGPATDEVNVHVVLKDVGEYWQKEIFTETMTSEFISIPLDIDNILEIGNRINTELGWTSPRFNIEIIAEDESPEYPFIATLKGELSSSILEWEEGRFSHIERGFPGVDDWTKGSFGYKIRLKENEIFGPIILEKEPSLPNMVIADSSAPLTTDLIESMDINFAYQFDYNGDFDSFSEIEIEMLIEDTGKWQRSFALLSSTANENSFTITIPLDIDKLIEIAADADEDIGGRGTGEFGIIITAQVHTTAETDSGTIDEAYSHQLIGSVGERIEWLGAESPGGEITLVSTGNLTEEITEPNSVWQILRISSIVGLAVSLLFVFAWAFFWWMGRKQTLSAREQLRKIVILKEEELNRNRKVYDDLISEVQDLPQSIDGETVINVTTLKSLANISNNSLKPILLRDEVDRHIYCVIDGSVRYIYTSRFEIPGDEAE